MVSSRRPIGPAAFALTALTVLVAALPASAQTGDEDPRATAKIHVGPFYVKPSIQLSDVGFDNNVFNTVEGRQSDFTLTALPRVDVFTPFGRKFDLKTSADSQMVYFRTFVAQRSIGADINETLNVNLQRISLSVTGQYEDYRRRPNLEIDARVRQRSTGYGVSASVNVTNKFTLGAGAGTTTNQYDDDVTFLNTPLATTLNHTSQTAHADVEYALSPYTRVAVQATVNQDRFPRSPERSNQGVRVLPKLFFSPRALISGSAAIGFRQLFPGNAILPSFKGLIGQVGLSYKWYDTTLVSVSAGRDMIYSFEVAEPYYVSNDAGVKVRRHLFGRFDGTIGATFYRNDYRRFFNILPVADAPAGSDIPPHSDYVTNYRITLGAKVARTVRFEWGVAYWRRHSSTDHFRDYNNFQLMSALSQGQ